MSYPLNLVEFELWLKSKDEKDFVGSKGCSRGCPIFKCLQDKKEQVYAVGEQNTEFLLPNGNYGTLDNPKWVWSFVRKIDSTATNALNGDVTAKEALQIVNNLHICTVCNTYNPEGTNCGKKDNCPW